MRATLASLGRGAATVAAVLSAVSLQAHHASISIDLTTPIWVKGTVARYELINPHTIIELDESVGAELRRWRIEGPFLARFKRMDVDERLLEAGDVIEVCGFPSKDAAPDRQSSERSSGPPRSFHGHILVLPDGQLRSWGPYGKIDNCVRPGDDRERWLELLQSDALAKEAWCDKARASIPTRAESRALVDEITRSMAQPCASAPP